MGLATMCPDRLALPSAPEPVLTCSNAPADSASDTLTDSASSSTFRDSVQQIRQVPSLVRAPSSESPMRILAASITFSSALPTSLARTSEATLRVIEESCKQRDQHSNFSSTDTLRRIGSPPPPVGKVVRVGSPPRVGSPSPRKKGTTSHKEFDASATSSTDASTGNSTPLPTLQSTFSVGAASVESDAAPSSSRIQSSRRGPELVVRASVLQSKPMTAGSRRHGSPCIPSSKARASSPSHAVAKVYSPSPVDDANSSVTCTTDNTVQHKVPGCSTSLHQCTVTSSCQDAVEPQAPQRFISQSSGQLHVNNSLSACSSDTGHSESGTRSPRHGSLVAVSQKTTRGRSPPAPPRVLASDINPSTQAASKGIGRYRSSLLVPSSRTDGAVSPPAPTTSERQGTPQASKEAVAALASGFLSTYSTGAGKTSDPLRGRKGGTPERSWRSACGSKDTTPERNWRASCANKPSTGERSARTAASSKDTTPERNWRTVCGSKDVTPERSTRALCITKDGTSERNWVASQGGRASGSKDSTPERSWRMQTAGKETQERNQRPSKADSADLSNVKGALPRSSRFGLQPVRDQFQTPRPKSFVTDACNSSREESVVQSLVSKGFLSSCPKVWTASTNQQPDDLAHVGAMFSTQMPGTTVNAVYRVENPGLGVVYDAVKASLGTKVEHMLWHGTSSDCVRNITLNGFNRAYCGRHGLKYGHGTYFSVSADYSSRFCDKRQTSRVVFLASVLVGEWTRGSPELVEPPHKDSEGMIRFDSTVDNEESPKIFCVFRDFQAIPLYLVEFTGPNA